MKTEKKTSDCTHMCHASARGRAIAHKATKKNTFIEATGDAHAHCFSVVALGDVASKGLVANTPSPVVPVWNPWTMGGVREEFPGRHEVSFLEPTAEDFFFEMPTKYGGASLILRVCEHATKHTSSEAGPDNCPVHVPATFHCSAAGAC